MPYEVYLNGPQSTLNGSIDSSVTAIVVTDGSQFAAGDTGIWHAVLDDGAGTLEIITVDGTQRSGNTLNGVTRGAEGTASAFPSGAKLTSVLTAGALDHVVQIADEGTLVATRRKLNFVGAGVSAADNSGSLRADVTIPGPGPQDIDILFRLDGGGSTVPVNDEQFLSFDYAATITGIELYTPSTDTGTVTIDILKTSYATYPTASSICGGSVPAISSGNKYRDTTLTGWTTAISAGDRFFVRATAVSGLVTSVRGFLKIQRPGAGINNAAGTFTVQNNGSAIAQRSILNFTSNIAAADDPGNSRINLSFTPPVITQYAVVVDEQTSGTNGGTFTSGAWRTRTLNTKRVDPNGIVSLASNQMTLAAGTYRVQAWGHGFYCGVHQIRLRDVTNSATLALGVNASSENGSSAGTGTHSHLAGRFTLAGSAAIELQHWCQTTRATDGLGRPLSTGTNECYATVVLEKE